LRIEAQEGKGLMKGKLSNPYPLNLRVCGEKAAGAVGHTLDDSRGDKPISGDFWEFSTGKAKIRREFDKIH